MGNKVRAGAGWNPGRCSGSCLRVRAVVCLSLYFMLWPFSRSCMCTHYCVSTTLVSGGLPAWQGVRGCTSGQGVRAYEYWAHSVNYME